MPRKIDLLQEVYQTQLATLTYSREVWCSFLRTAAFQYKYSFPDQVLIWSQRPHARACAELELWNKVFDRWVNRHAKGIALIKDKGSYTGIRYVFDVADTHGRRGEELKLWQVRNGYHDDVTEALENRFGELEDDSSFVASVISACQNAVEDNMTDYLSDLFRLTGNSALEGMDEDNLKVRLRSILISSVAYTVLTRIGEDSDMFLDFDAFDDLRFYNTAETINLLGNATRDIAEVCLREIERTVKNCDKENRTFDEKGENEYEVRPFDRTAYAAMREDARKMKRYSEEAKLLAANGIVTAEDLRHFTENIGIRFKALAYERARNSATACAVCTTAPLCSLPRKSFMT